MSEPNSPIVFEDAPSTVTSSTASYRPRGHRRSPNVVLKLFVVFSLVANSVLVTMVILKWSPGTKPEAPSGPTSEGQSGGLDRRVCFTCNYLGPEIESNNTMYDVFRTPQGNTMCCLRGKSQLSALFHRILQDMYSQTGTSGAVPVLSDIYGVTGAHLYMSVDGSTPQWTSLDTYNTAFCSRVICKEGNITVTEGGTYLVYSHVSFFNNRRHTADSNLLHVIYRHNADLSGIGEVKLLFSKSSPKRTPQQASFMAAMVNLRRNDVLRVGLSRDYYPLLDRRRFANFFGVIKM